MGQYFKVLLNQSIIKKKYSPIEYGCKLMVHSNIDCSFVKYICELCLDTPTKIAWVGDSLYEEDLQTLLPECLYSLIHKTDFVVEEKYLKLNSEILNNDYTVVNLTKKEFINIKTYINIQKKRRLKKCEIVHPLPILLALGNGNGGGDYYLNINSDKAGLWVGDEIIVSLNYKFSPFNDYKDMSGIYLFEDKY